MKILISCCVSVFAVWLMLPIGIVGSTNMTHTCESWQGLVGGQEKPVQTPSNIDLDNEAEVFEGIECLLKLEGNKSHGTPSGATHMAVSDILPSAAVEVSALHYISYLYYKRFDYANGVALVLSGDGSNDFNSQEAISLAYKSYREWFVKIKETGLKEAREKKIDPLEGSAVKWY
ncbi:MAG: hypothetical protein R2684_12145 [Pyrinomonadaceae bacterium]